MMKSEKKVSEAFKRKALARWRLLSSRGMATERVADEIGVAAVDLAMWIRAVASEALALGQRADHGQPAGREGRRARAGRGQRNVEVEVVVNGADLRPRCGWRPGGGRARR